MINPELALLIDHLEKFNTKADLKNLTKAIKNIDKIKQKQEKEALKDKLEGLMNAEGAGALIVDGCSLPQVAQKILINISHYYL